MSLIVIGASRALEQMRGGGPWGGAPERLLHATGPAHLLFWATPNRVTTTKLTVRPPFGLLTLQRRLLLPLLPEEIEGGGDTHQAIALFTPGAELRRVARTNRCDDALHEFFHLFGRAANESRGREHV